MIFMAVSEMFPVMNFFFFLYPGGPHSSFLGDFLLYPSAMCACGFAVLLGKFLFKLLFSFLIMAKIC